MCKTEFSGPHKEMPFIDSSSSVYINEAVYNDVDTRSHIYYPLCSVI